MDLKTSFHNTLHCTIKNFQLKIDCWKFQLHCSFSLHNLMQIHPAVTLNRGTWVCNAQDAVTNIWCCTMKRKIWFYCTGKFPNLNAIIKFFFLLSIFWDAEGEFKSGCWLKQRFCNTHADVVMLHDLSSLKLHISTIQILTHGLYNLTFRFRQTDRFPWKQRLFGTKQRIPTLIWY